MDFKRVQAEEIRIPMGRDGVVLVCRTLKHEEMSELQDLYAFNSDQPRGGTRTCLEALRQALISVEKLTVDGKPFDPKKDFDLLPYAWKVEAGAKLFEDSRLSAEEQGNS